MTTHEFLGRFLPVTDAQGKTKQPLLWALLSSFLEAQPSNWAACNKLAHNRQNKRKAKSAGASLHSCGFG